MRTPKRSHVVVGSTEPVDCLPARCHLFRSRAPTSWSAHRLHDCQAGSCPSSHPLPSPLRSTRRVADGHSRSPPSANHRCTYIKELTASVTEPPISAARARTSTMIQAAAIWSTSDGAIIPMAELARETR